MHLIPLKPILAILLAVGFACVVAAAPETKSVSIKDMKFDPANLSVTVGDTVRWTNDDERDHTVTAADGSFRSGNLRRGDTFEHKFDRPGKFAYSCSYHPRMKASVTVTE